MTDKVLLYAVGDVAAFRENPATMFEHTAPVLNQADILFFQNERHLTRRTTWLPDVTHTEHVPPENAEGLRAVKFDVASFAGNHTMDLGFEAMFDTIDVLKSMGIRVIGVGKNIAEARKPAIIERKGVKVGFLAYTSVIRPGAEAGTYKPGVAPMRGWTLYNQMEIYPGGEPEIHTFPNREDLAALLNDVKKLRPLVDVLVLSFHWGIFWQPMVIADYQKDVAHAAIDAGADLILGHHPHILKGIEVYKGKAIFYSMGHFAFDVTLKVREDWAKGRPEMYAKLIEFRKRFRTIPIEPDWLDSKIAYPREHRNTMIVKCMINNKAIEKVSFLPAVINKQAQPYVVNRQDEHYDEIVNYLSRISLEAGLEVKLKPEEDEVIVYP